MYNLFFSNVRNIQNIFFQKFIRAKQNFPNTQNTQKHTKSHKNARGSCRKKRPEQTKKLETAHNLKSNDATIVRAQVQCGAALSARYRE